MNDDQQDEVEALQIIYSGDDAYKQVAPNEHQFKIGDDGKHFSARRISSRPGAPHSFLLQVSWPDDYPSTSGPQLSLDVFYNQHLLPNVKKDILKALNEEVSGVELSGWKKCIV